MTVRNIQNSWSALSDGKHQVKTSEKKKICQLHIHENWYIKKHKEKLNYFFSYGKPDVLYLLILSGPVMTMRKCVSNLTVQDSLKLSIDNNWPSKWPCANRPTGLTFVMVKDGRAIGTLSWLFFYWSQLWGHYRTLVELYDWPQLARQYMPYHLLYLLPSIKIIDPIWPDSACLMTYYISW